MKKLISTLLIGATVMVAFPAHADRTGDVIGGVFGGIILGSLLSQSRTNTTYTTTYTPTPVYHSTVYQPPVYQPLVSNCYQTVYITPHEQVYERIPCHGEVTNRHYHRYYD